MDGYQIFHRIPHVIIHEIVYLINEVANTCG